MDLDRFEIFRLFFFILTTLVAIWFSIRARKCNKNIFLWFIIGGALYIGSYIISEIILDVLYMGIKGSDISTKAEVLNYFLFLKISSAVCGLIISAPVCLLVLKKNDQAAYSVDEYKSSDNTEHLSDNHSDEGSLRQKHPQNAAEKNDVFTLTDEDRLRKVARIIEVLYQHAGIDRFFISPFIPTEKIMNAKKSCSVIADDKILGLIDTTYFGSAKECLLICDNAIYMNGYQKYRFELEDFSNISIKSTSDILSIGDYAISVISVEDQKIENLMIAVQERIKQVVTNREVEHSNGRTLLHYAAITGEEHLPEDYFKNIDINATDSKGRSALHYAAQFGQEQFCKMLISKGAKVSLPDKGNSSPIDLAADRRFYNIMRILESHGAKKTKAPFPWTFSFGRAFSAVVLTNIMLYFFAFSASLKNQLSGYRPDQDSIIFMYLGFNLFAIIIFGFKKRISKE